MDVTGKIAAVTGGGRGIGRGIVPALARNGAGVLVADINPDDAEGVAGEVREAGRDSIAVLLDVTVQDSVDRMVQEVLPRFERIDVLVNNAGIYAASGFEERDEANEEDWDMIYEVNVKGIVRVISYTQASALELAPYNANVNAICPGLLWTTMSERIAVRRRESPAENPDGLSPRGFSIAPLSETSPSNVNRHPRTYATWQPSWLRTIQGTPPASPSTSTAAFA